MAVDKDSKWVSCVPFVEFALNSSIVGFNPEDPFLVGLWAECLDCSGYVGGYASKRKCLVVYVSNVV